MVDSPGEPFRGYHVALQIERSFDWDSSHAYSQAFRSAYRHRCIVVVVGFGAAWLLVVVTFDDALTEDSRSSSVVVVVAAVGTLLAPVDLGSNVVRHVHLVQHQVACQPS